MTEITITIKGEDSTFKQKHLIYEDYQLSESDPLIKRLVDETVNMSKIQPETIKVRALLVYQ